MAGNLEYFKGTAADFEALITDPVLGLSLGFHKPVCGSNLNSPFTHDAGVGFFPALDGETGSPASPLCLGGSKIPLISTSHEAELPEIHQVNPKYSDMTCPMREIPSLTHTAALSQNENGPSFESPNGNNLGYFLMNGAGQQSPLTLPSVALLPSDVPKAEDGPSTTSFSQSGPYHEKLPMNIDKECEFDPANISFLFENTPNVTSKKTDPRLHNIANSLLSTERVLDSQPPIKTRTAGTGIKAKASKSVSQMLKLNEKKAHKKTPQKARKDKEPAQSSKHCHICARSGQRANLAGCKNLRRETDSCRKVVCRKCFGTLKKECSFKDATQPGQEWECLHCRLPDEESVPGGCCPAHAQCKIYAKTNARRRNENLKKKRLRDGEVKTIDRRKIQTLEAVGTSLNESVCRSAVPLPFSNDSLEIDMFSLSANGDVSW